MKDINFNETEMATGGGQENGNWGERACKDLSDKARDACADSSACSALIGPERAQKTTYDECMKSFNKTKTASAIENSGGNESSGRVICTHFMRKGLMDQALWRADIAFTRQHLPAAMVRGYHLWAIPYVRLMRRSPWAEKLMLPLALWRAEEIAFRMGLREKGNWKGKLLRWTGEPVCWLIGKVTPEQDWESLWRENSAAV